VTHDVDVAIVGAGPVGACLAALLIRQAGFSAGRVAILEREIPSRWRADEPPDLRVWSLSHASQRILDEAGAWKTIAASRASPYERMRVWPAGAEPHGAEGVTFDAAEVGEPDLGHVVENHLVQSALLAALQAAGGEVTKGAVRALRFGPDSGEIDVGAETWRASLVVAADGARSAVRELAGIDVTRSDYGQTALVANVTPERPHERTAWQRFLEPGTLALLPLASGECSIVWSVPDEHARRLIAAPAAVFDSELTAASDRVLGELRLASERVSFPLQRLSAERYVIERCALVGDAAHVVHPLAGQGVNLGLLDAATLSRALAGARDEGEDPGALRVLRRYERERKAENELMADAIDAFNRYLATGGGRLASLAQRGLSLVDRSLLAKRFFAGRALGN
jgi:ubiquinone biosynthesis UbiH/UbiF/VisC/COQ6 family hydroxylase